ncbi:MAG: Hsp20/alpha crystallin family protein [Candidatus Moranbacteria bacterium]|nr:Hsp20/alpha crystallin family protein [Candidatus Moranbacteria bacterium]
MTKIKKSFFERLTGASALEENSYEIEKTIHPTGNMYEERETEMFINSATPTSQQPAREESISINTDDSEGQLTIDVYQTDTDIVIKSTIAGVKPEDLDVSINNDMLTVRGERKNDEQVPEENYYYQECYWGTFSRSVILPVDVVSDKIEASMKNGILTVRMPKATNNRLKKIQVRGF